MNFLRKRKQQRMQHGIKISCPKMMETYRHYKAVELQLKGAYDYVKYGAMSNLTEDSFFNESGQFKMAVRAITFMNLKDSHERLASCLYIAGRHMIEQTLRSEIAREYKYTSDYDLKPVKALIEQYGGGEDNWLFERQFAIVRNLRPLVEHAERLLSLNNESN